MDSREPPIYNAETAPDGSDDLHRLLEIEAAKRDVTIQSLIEEALRLKRENGKR